MTQLSLWCRSGAVTRPATRAVSTMRAKSSAAASSAPAAGGGGLLAMLTAWLLLFGLLVVAPVVMLAYGVEPGVVLMWMGMIVASMAITWWSERHEQRQWRKRHGKPRRENYPAGAAYREKWGTAESYTADEKPAAATPRRSFWGWAARVSAGKTEAAPASPTEPVPCYVAFEGHDPRFLETRPYTVCDAIMDAHAEALAAGLSREDTIDHMASALSGAKPAGRGRQQAGGGAGPRVRGGVERLGRGGLKGYLRGGR